MPKLSLTYKKVLITGASSGIGEELAYRFAENGSELILVARREDELLRVRDKCLELGAAGSTHLCCDMSQRDSVDSLCYALIERKLLPEVIILNAGVSQRALTLDTDFSVDEKLMELNYLSNVRLIKNLKEHLINSPKINIAINTSISGIFGFPLRSAYASSKRALFGFFESLDLEYPNIHCTFIIPGRINTPISRSALLADGSKHQEMDPGQALGMSAAQCSRIALKAIIKGKRKKLIGGKELLMVYFYKYLPCIFNKLARNISAK